ncbi:hypothetical protein, partial [Methylobacterium sp. WL6]|uniref:hypothetical protein n=1 Tax=Methylobacterium sp. WL6 TaxID=2603901 RepID=UPI001AEEF2AD
MKRDGLVGCLALYAALYNWRERCRFARPGAVVRPRGRISPPVRSAAPVKMRARRGATRCYAVAG